MIRKLRKIIWTIIIFNETYLSFNWIIQSEEILTAKITAQNKVLGYPGPEDEYIGLIRMDRFGKKSWIRAIYKKIHWTFNVDYEDGTLLNHLFFIVMRRRISGHFSHNTKKNSSEIKNKITSQKFILEGSCSFYNKNILVSRIFKG